MRDFIKDLLGYLVQRTLLIVISIYSFVVSLLYKAKGYFVQNLFWGRNNLYKNFFQLGMSILTIILGLSGVTNSFALGTTTNRSNSAYLTKSEEIIDVNQGKDISFEASYIQDPKGDKYIVQSGDTLEIIARKVIQIEKEEFGDTSEVTNERVKRKIDVIRFTNNLFSDNPKLRVGQELSVFLGIDGVIHTVQKGDTISGIAKKYRVEEQTIIDTNHNNIEADFIDGDTNKIVLEVGSQIFVPNIDLTQQLAEGKSKIDEANKSKAKRTYVPPKTVAGGDFRIPLGNDCGGWVISQRFSATHNGMDLAKGGGCTIVAADSGTVTVAGYTTGGGAWYVEINHGNGFTTSYSHLVPGSISVSPGMVVAKGTRIGYMGRSGRATGVHLHLMMTYNGKLINPAPKIGL